MKALAITAALLVLIASPAAAKLLANGENLNRMADNGFQLNKLAVNKLVANTVLLGGLGQDAARSDLIGSVELTGVELPR